MDRCLEDQNEQAWRLLNNTGISSIPVSALDGVDGDIYKELLHNASVLYNETLITCNKTEFLTVRILGQTEKRNLRRNPPGLRVIGQNYVPKLFTPYWKLFCYCFKYLIKRNLL